jgi:hypothetical protein
MKNSMSKSISKQRGLTMISWMVVIVFFLFQAVIAMNVLPVYFTDSTVATVIEQLPSDADAQRATAKELKKMVMKRLGINSVYSIKPEFVTVKKARDEKVVTIEYEPRGTLIGNLEFIVSLKHEAKIPNR